MATHLKDLKIGDRTYYISHGGETVYYSTSGRGKGSTSIKGIKFKKNEIILNDTGEVATDYEIGTQIKK